MLFKITSFHLIKSNLILFGHANCYPCVDWTETGLSISVFVRADIMP